MRHLPGNALLLGQGLAAVLAVSRHQPVLARGHRDEPRRKDTSELRLPAAPLIVSKRLLHLRSFLQTTQSSQASGSPAPALAPRTSVCRGAFLVPGWRETQHGLTTAARPSHALTSRICFARYCWYTRCWCSCSNSDCTPVLSYGSAATRDGDAVLAVDVTRSTGIQK